MLLSNQLEDNFPILIISRFEYIIDTFSNLPIRFYVFFFSVQNERNIFIYINDEIYAFEFGIFFIVVV